jgi:hypothetical protein
VSAQTTPVKPEQGNWKQGLSDYQVVTALMKRMGSKKGFDPMPPDQHSWQMSKGEPPLHRIWSWLCAHTIHWGHRNEYAVSVHGEELHIEHLAKDLEMDERNAGMYWREGIEKGLWRYGTKAEGRRKLFLCGRVTAKEAPSSDQDHPDENVCTNVLSPYILKQIKELAPERQQQFWQEYGAAQRLRKDVQAELIAASRLIFDQDDDNRFLAYGIKKIRQEHARKSAIPEEVEARRRRIEEIAPVVRTYVHTCAAAVQTNGNGSYNAALDSAQTGATLLPQRPLREDQSSGAGGHSKASPQASRTPPVDRRESPNQLPVPEKGKPLEEKTGPEVGEKDREAYELLFSEIARMQTSFPHTDFASERIDRQNRGDQVTVRNILHAIGGHANTVEFLLSCAGKFRGLDRNALGKLPARPPGSPTGPRSLGLIYDWAKDFGRARGIPQRDRAKGASHA